MSEDHTTGRTSINQRRPMAIQDFNFYQRCPGCRALSYNHTELISCPVCATTKVAMEMQPINRLQFCTEMAAYLQSERARADAAEARCEALEQWYDGHTEREAAVCPEDMSCTEYIGYLLNTLAETVAAKDRVSASLTRVWALATHDTECPQRSGGVCNCAFLSTPVADLEAHDAKVREPLEKLIERLNIELDESEIRRSELAGAIGGIVGCLDARGTVVYAIDRAREVLKRYPPADLAAHDARIRREALEAAAKKCATAYWEMVAPRDHAAMHPTIEFWREALDLPAMTPAEHEAQALREPRHPEIVLVDELAMLVRQLVHSLRKHSPDNETARKAVDYLRRHELQGSPLRTAILSPAPDAAQPNNQQEQP